WLIAGLVLEAVSLFCYALLTRALLPPEGRPNISRLFRIDLAAAAVAHVIPAGTVGSAGVGFQLFTSEGLDGTDVGVMMATKGMGSTVVLNVLLWLALVISIPLSGFRPVYATVAIVGAVLLAAMAALVVGLTRGGKRAGRILRAIGDKIPGVGGERLEKIVLQADESLRRLASDRHVLVGSLTWAALNWLFVAAFGSFANPVGLFAAYGIANVLGAILVTPAGLGVIDSVTPVLLVSFGLTRSVATLGVLSWRLVNFWLPIPSGAAAYVSLKVPRGAGIKAMRRALAELTARGAHSPGPAGQPAQDPAGQPAQDPAGQPAQDPAGQPAQDPAGQPAQDPAGQPAQQRAEEPAGQPAADAAAEDDPTGTRS